jgi:hypothetical protein
MDSWCPGRVLNSGPPEYETGVLSVHFESYQLTGYQENGITCFFNFCTYIFVRSRNSVDFHNFAVTHSAMIFIS